jgi:hypothetical protein
MFFRSPEAEIMHSTLLPAPKASKSRPAACRDLFLTFFPKGFNDPGYIDWERGYTWESHRQWTTVLDRVAIRAMLKMGDCGATAAHPLRVESKMNLLFSFEKMVLRDGLRSAEGATTLAEGL